MKRTASRVLGVDSSTNSIAWCLYWNRRPSAYGESMLEGDIPTRLGQVRKKFDRILREQKPDFVLIEKAVFINNKDVHSKLSKVVGVLESCCAVRGIPCEDIVPRRWQYAIGNDSWSQAQKRDLRKEFPGKSSSWINNEIRRRRKQFTIDFFQDTYGVKPKNDNVADAMGIARIGYYELTKR